MSTESYIPAVERNAKELLTDSTPKELEAIIKYLPIVISERITNHIAQVATLQHVQKLLNEE